VKISADHFLDGAKRDLIVGGSPMNIRRVLVMHFTGGATAASSVEAMRQRNVSAHLVVDRDGSVIQCRAFNRVASHAGVSRWVDPHTRTKYNGVNSCGIGIEIANAGNDPGALSWARKQPGFASITARHRNGSPMLEWETFPAAQLQAVFQVAQLLVASYKLDDLTGHDCIAPERKDDPGPAFPMLELRAACGFTGLPVVHQP
jgi:N-acetylmuramoyl-L-alanine amidase